MNITLLVIVLALGWAAATGTFTLLNLLLGAALAGLFVYLVRGPMKGAGYGRRLLRILRLAALFLYELVLSSVRVAALVLSPDMSARLKPALIAYPLSATTDQEITLLANLITLTPGTLSVDVSADKKTLWIHALELTDREAFIRDLASGFERQVIEACR